DDTDAGKARRAGTLHPPTPPTPRANSRKAGPIRSAAQHTLPKSLVRYASDPNTWHVDKFQRHLHDDRYGGSAQLPRHGEVHLADQPYGLRNYALHRAASTGQFHSVADLASTWFHSS